MQLLVLSNLRDKRWLDNSPKSHQAHPGPNQFVIAAKCELDAGTNVQLSYEPAYLASERAFALDPLHLPLSSSQLCILRSPNDSYGILSDAGPEAWGKQVISQVMKQNRMPIPATIVDWLRVASNNGVGCLGFSNDSETHVQLAQPAPLSLLDRSTLHLVRQLSAHEDVVIDDDALRVIWPGVSLGGARPKTTLLHEGIEYIAKFSRQGDPFNMPIAEYATLRLAYLAGITVPDFELTEIAGEPVFIVSRFDREPDGSRLHYISARTLLDIPALSADLREYKTNYSYAGIVQAGSRISDQAAAIGRELFRRMIFNILVGNVDDHLRNHGYLMNRSGKYVLAPAFDLVPHPDAADTPQSIGVGSYGCASTMENALSQCDRFYLDPNGARKIIEEVREAVSKWLQIYRETGMSTEDIQTVSKLFQLDA